jgi:hypothetical protein
LSDLHVELKPHIGQQRTEVGMVDVTLPQSVIFVNGVWAGYVADEPGSHISIIVKVPDSTLAEIKQKVDAIRGSASQAITQIKTVQQSANIKASDVPSLSDVEL